MLIFWSDSSIHKARPTNSHSLALVSDSKLFKEVLKPLEVAVTTTLVVDLSSPLQPFDDNNDALANEPLMSLCEEVLHHNLKILSILLFCCAIDPHSLIILKSTSAFIFKDDMICN